MNDTTKKDDLTLTWRSPKKISQLGYTSCWWNYWENAHKI